MLNNPGDFLKDTFNFVKDFGIPSAKNMLNNGLNNLAGTNGDPESAISKLWKDYTGQSAIELQNKLERDRAEEEYQRNLDSIGDTKAAYEAAGYNPNLMYGANPVQYQAPHLQEYSGSRKLDTILSRVGKVLSSIPMLYQATAALEGIDQARERTKQSEIKTMSMGMSLLDQGYKLGDQYLSKPFIPQFRNGMNPLYYMFPQQRGEYSYNGKILSEGDLGRYADASLKHQFDLLESIGIKNRMNSTLNSWRGYQFGLDQKYGEAGKIIGLGTSLMGGISKLYPLKLK